MSDRQTQRGGDRSQQIQVAGDLVLGVTERRAAEIADETARLVVAEYSAEAREQAARRIGELDGRLIERLLALDALEAFVDPAFHVALRRAQVGAASSERASDYDMLAELLADRALRGRDRTVRAGLQKAIDIVDQVDDDALLGLTVFQAAVQYSPSSGDHASGLDALEALFSQLITSDLPLGGDWLDHLDILDAVRMGAQGELRSFADFFVNFSCPGYACPGVAAEREREILKEAAALSMPDPGLVPHALKPDFKRLPAVSLGAFEQALIPGLSPGQREFAMRIAREDVQLAVADPVATEALMLDLDRRPFLRRLHEWWDQIPNSVTVTSAGRVLARANAKRGDTLGLLPDLD